MVTLRIPFVNAKAHGLITQLFQIVTNISDDIWANSLILIFYIGHKQPNKSYLFGWIRQNQIYICNKSVFIKETKVIFVIITFARWQCFYIFYDTFFCYKRRMILIENFVLQLISYIISTSRLSNLRTANLCDNKLISISISFELAMNILQVKPDHKVASIAVRAYHLYPLRI